MSVINNNKRLTEKCFWIFDDVILQYGGIAEREYFLEKNNISRFLNKD